MHAWKAAQHCDSEWTAGGPLELASSFIYTLCTSRLLSKPALVPVVLHC